MYFMKIVVEVLIRGHRPFKASIRLMNNATAYFSSVLNLGLIFIVTHVSPHLNN